jgi:hypothetical protein
MKIALNKSLFSRKSDIILDLLTMKSILKQYYPIRK